MAKKKAKVTVTQVRKALATIAFKPNQSPQMAVTANLGSTEFYSGRIEELMANLHVLSAVEKKEAIKQIARMATLFIVHAD